MTEMEMERFPFKVPDRFKNAPLNKIPILWRELTWEITQNCLIKKFLFNTVFEWGMILPLPSDSERERIETIQHLWRLYCLELSDKITQVLRENLLLIIESYYRKPPAPLEGGGRWLLTVSIVEIPEEDKKYYLYSVV